MFELPLALPSDRPRLRILRAWVAARLAEQPTDARIVITYLRLLAEQLDQAASLLHAAERDPQAEFRVQRTPSGHSIVHTAVCTVAPRDPFTVSSATRAVVRAQLDEPRVTPCDLCNPVDALNTDPPR
jgi:hypothetical protein